MGHTILAWHNFAKLKEFEPACGDHVASCNDKLLNSYVVHKRQYCREYAKIKICKLLIMFVFLLRGEHASLTEACCF